MADKLEVRADEDKSERAKEIEDALKADADKKKADAENDLAANVTKLTDTMDKLVGAMGGICDRMDALEGGKKKTMDDEPGKPKEPVADADDDGDTPAGKNALVDAQVKADKVASAHGQSAPPPMSGERPMAYRRRLLRPFQAYCDSFKDVDLHAIEDKTVFAGIEAKIYADAAEAGKRPQVVAGTLRERSRKTPSGHTIIDFYGDPRAWMDTFSGQAQAVTAFGSSLKA